MVAAWYCLSSACYANTPALCIHRRVLPRRVLHVSRTADDLRNKLKELSDLVQRLEHTQCSNLQARAASCLEGWRHQLTDKLRIEFLEVTLQNVRTFPRLKCVMWIVIRVVQQRFINADQDHRFNRLQASLGFRTRPLKLRTVQSMLLPLAQTQKRTQSHCGKSLKDCCCGW